MSQRLNNRNLLDVIAGMPVYSIMGSEKDDSNGDGNGNGDGDGDGKPDPSPAGSKVGDGNEDDDGNEDNGNEENDGESEGDLKEKLHKLSRENSRWRHQVRDLENKQKAAQKKIEGFESKNKSELEKAQADLEKSKAELSSISASYQNSVIEREFLKSNKYKWQDAGAALKLIDLDNVTIDEDGKVKGMNDAIKQLATDYPFLVSNNGDENGAGGKPTGSSPGGKKKDNRELERTALEKKYRL